MGTLSADTVVAVAVGSAGSCRRRTRPRPSIHTSAGNRGEPHPAAARSSEARVAGPPPPAAARTGASLNRARTVSGRTRTTPEPARRSPTPMSPLAVPAALVSPGAAPTTDRGAPLGPPLRSPPQAAPANATTAANSTKAVRGARLLPTRPQLAAVTRRPPIRRSRTGTGLRYPGREEARLRLLKASWPVVRVVLSVVMLAVLVSRLHGRSSGLLAIRRSGSIALVAVACAVTLVGIVLSAVRWQRVLSALELPSHMGILLRHYLAGLFVGNFLPSTIGGD